MQPFHRNYHQDFFIEAMQAILWLNHFIPSFKTLLKSHNIRWALWTAEFAEKQAKLQRSVTRRKSNKRRWKASSLRLGRKNGDASSRSIHGSVEKALEAVLCVAFDLSKSRPTETSQTSISSRVVARGRRRAHCGHGLKTKTKTKKNKNTVRREALPKRPSTVKVRDCQKFVNRQGKYTTSRIH